MYIKPGQDISLLSHQEQCGIVLQAATDTRWIETLSASKQRDIRVAASYLPEPSPILLRAAILAIVNHETALAAENGEYNEWWQYERMVLDNDRQPRPFMAAVRIAVLGGAIPTVWTCGEVHTGELRLKRAIFRLGGVDIKLEEYWRNHHQRLGYPDLRSYELEDLPG